LIINISSLARHKRLKHAEWLCVRCQHRKQTTATIKETKNVLHVIQLEILAMQMVISYRKSDINCLFGGVTSLLTDNQCFESFLLLHTVMEYNIKDKDQLKLHIIRQWALEEERQQQHLVPRN
jgi:hypothetical protein